MAEHTFTPQYAGEWKNQRVGHECEAMVNRRETLVYTFLIN